MKIVKAPGNSAPVRLREEPNGKILINIPQGTSIEVLSSGPDWCEIEVNGQVGWMMSKYIYDDEESKKTDLSELKEKLKEVLQLLEKMEA